VRSVEADAAADATAETAALRDRLLNYPDVRASLAAPSVEAEGAPILPMRFAKGRVALELLTTIATLGTPRDVTLQELRVECFFPMNDETREVFRRWASPRTAAGWRRRSSLVPMSDSERADEGQ
jgi:hypothetical protein